MRPCAVRIVYPSWVRGVASLAVLIDAHRGATVSSIADDGSHALQLRRWPGCLAMLGQPQEAPPRLDLLHEALRARGIPFDVFHIDLDRPGRGVSSKVCWRRTKDFDLVAHELADDVALCPVADAHDDLGSVANVLSACLLAPDHATAAADLLACTASVGQLRQHETAALLAAAYRSNRFDESLGLMMARGIAIDAKSIAAAGALLPSGPPWQMHQAFTRRLYGELLEKLGCGLRGTCSNRRHGTGSMK